MAWAPDYVTTAELAAYLRIGDAVDDTELALAISAASRAVDRHTNRQFGQDDTDAQRFYTARYDRRRCRWIVETDDLMIAPTSVDVDHGDDGTFEAEVDSFVLEPRNAAADSRPWTSLVVARDSTSPATGIPGGVRVTARFGWTAVPDPVKQATLLQAARVFVRREAPFGVAGSPETGSEMRLLARVDPDVAVTLGPYVRWFGAA